MWPPEVHRISTNQSTENNLSMKNLEMISYHGKHKYKHEQYCQPCKDSKHGNYMIDIIHRVLKFFESRSHRVKRLHRVKDVTILLNALPKNCDIRPIEWYHNGIWEWIFTTKNRENIWIFLDLLIERLLLCHIVQSPLNASLWETLDKTSYARTLKCIEIADKEWVGKTIGQDSFLDLEKVNHRKTYEKRQKEHCKSKYDHR